MREKHNHKVMWVLVVLISFSCSKKKIVADMIIRGGRIYTAAAQMETVEAVAVAGDTIVYAGNEEGLAALAGEHTQVLDLHGKTMTPGFIESHGHLMGLGFSELSLDLSKVKNYEELVAKVKEAVAHGKPGEWIQGFGWHQEKWDHRPAKMIKGFQTHEMLSAVSPDNPVFLLHASGHAGFANAKAMQLAGISALGVEKNSTNQTTSGEIIRDALGNPTGIFNERAQKLIADRIPPPSPEQMQHALELAMEACLRNGVTSFQDAGEPRAVLDLLQKNKAGGNLRVRLYEMITGYDPKLVNEWFARGPLIDSLHWLTIRSVKLNCDGALGSRGAWLLEPYSDRPGFYGNETFPMDTLLEVSRHALKAGFQVCAHAIGDRTNREILDRYEMAFKENPLKAKNARFRIEHVQHLNPSDIPRFGKLGVIASMQTVHLSSDRPWAFDRLGKKRIEEGAYVWQSLLKTGAVVINGTDVPVEPINPIASFYAAVTRKTLKGQPEGGYEPNEKMTRDQALSASTGSAAYGAFEEKFKGTLVKGKLADFTVFSQDIMTVAEDELLKTTVEITIVGGKIAWQKK